MVFSGALYKIKKSKLKKKAKNKNNYKKIKRKVKSLSLQIQKLKKVVRMTLIREKSFVWPKMEFTVRLVIVSSCPDTWVLAMAVRHMTRTRQLVSILITLVAVHLKMTKRAWIPV